MVQQAFDFTSSKFDRLPPCKCDSQRLYMSVERNNLLDLIFVSIKCNSCRRRIIGLDEQDAREMWTKAMRKEDEGTDNTKQDTITPGEARLLHDQCDNCE